VDGSAATLQTGGAGGGADGDGAALQTSGEENIGRRVKKLRVPQRQLV
jgi:hypothetical protein